MTKRLGLALTLIFAIGILLYVKYSQKKDANYLDYKKQTNESETRGESSLSGAYQSMQFLNQRRSYPENDIPQDKFFKAFEYTRANMQDFNSVTDASDSWESMGPNNIGGRSLCIAIHPVDTNILFMGSASGGLWKSTTGGRGAAAWTQINTDFPSIAISHVAINNTNPNEMYVGTGENYGYQSSSGGLDVRVTRGMYGIGILKTTDGGNTWTKSLDWSYNNQRGIWKVEYNPFNPNILYSATSEGVYKYNGSSWAKSLDVKMVMDLEVNPIDSNIIYASVGNHTDLFPLTDVGIYKTTNAGVNWFKLSGGLPSTWSGKTTIELYKGNPNIVVASISNDSGYVGLYRSVNGGVNWISFFSHNISGKQGWYNNALFIKQNDENKILLGQVSLCAYQVGDTAVTVNNNWGTWTSGPTPPGEPEGFLNYVHADIHYITSNPKDPNKIYIVADGGLYRSDDYCQTYYACNGGYVTSQFYGGFANSFQDSIWCLGGLQDNRAAFNIGTTAWYKTNGGDGTWADVNSQNDSICYIGVTNGVIGRSTNRGGNFSAASPPGAGIENMYAFVHPYLCMKSDPNIMYVGGNIVYKSTNGGSNWQGPYGASVFEGNRLISMAGSYTNPDTLYAGSAASAARCGVFRSVNGGLNWTNITGDLPDRYPTDLTVNPNNSKEVILTLGGFGTPHVYRSTNNGTNWTNISGNLPDMPYHSAVIDPLYTQNIYVGNDFATYVTTNGGNSWYEYRTGMPYTLVYDLTISYVNRKLRATTHGNGIWQRDLIENPVAIGNNNSVVNSFRLYQNYPNPFNPVTKIKFDLNKPAFVDIKIYDTRGAEIKNIYSRYDNIGSHETDFNASLLASGIYFYSILVNGKRTDTKKMMLVK